MKGQIIISMRTGEGKNMSVESATYMKTFAVFIDTLVLCQEKVQVKNDLAPM